MSNLFLILLVLSGLIAPMPLRAQGWDATRQASGWAFQEVDGSLIFYDPAARSLRTWMKGSGLLASLPVILPESRKPAAAIPAATPTPTAAASDYDAAGALLYGLPRQQRPQGAPAKPPSKEVVESATVGEAVPERWVLDAYDRIWMACDHRLAVLGKNGKPETTLPLPALVEDMAIGRDGLFILYRTPKPYLEKRDLKTGAVLWTFGDKAQLKESAAQPLLVGLNRMALGTDGSVYLAEGASMAFTVLDPAKGPKEPGQTFFTCNDALPARAVLGRVGRGPLLPWPGRDVIFGVFAPSQVKSCGAPESKGLLLARFDLAKGTMEWLPTPLGEGHRLIGLLDAEAVFLAPGGGLAYAPIH
ncbi:MAG: hypothetical protein HXX12_05125 [Geothrix sp.]|nr:hypothetical protein [Geothrix sp.]